MAPADDMGAAAAASRAEQVLLAFADQEVAAVPWQHSAVAARLAAVAVANSAGEHCSSVEQHGQYNGVQQVLELLQPPALGRELPW